MTDALEYQLPERRSSEEVEDVITRIKAMLSDHPTLSVLLVVLTVGRLVLAAATPLIPEMVEVYDDGLLARLGLSVASGDWLGSYDFMTLVKNPGYPLLLAFCGITGISYQLMLMSLQVAACIGACLAIAPLVRSRRIRAVIYLVLLNMPALFTTDFFQRVYRDGVLIPFVLIIFSCYVAMFLRADKPVRSLIPWAAVGGAALAFFYQIKEDSVWVMPFVVVCSLVVFAIWARRVHGGSLAVSEFVGRCVLLALPLLLTVGFTSLICSINYSRYGVSVTNERYQGSFSRAMGDLNRIDAGNQGQDVWVSRASLEEALECSPTLSSIRPEIERWWDAWVPTSGSTNDEMLGDYAYWALRDALNDAGGYSSATQADMFWTAVADELEDGFSSGRLSSKQGLFLSAITAPITLDAVPVWAADTLHHLWSLVSGVTFDDRLVTLESGNGDAALQANVQSMLGGNTIPGDSETSDVSTMAKLAVAIDDLLGVASIWIYRLSTFAFPVAVVALAFVDIRHRREDGAKTLLVVCGLLLSALTLVVGVTWSVGFVNPGDLSRRSLNLYRYSAAFFPLWTLAEAIVAGRLAESCVAWSHGGEARVSPGYEKKKVPCHLARPSL